MLQDQYEKHNLEIPFDKSTGLFHVKFKEKNYTVSYPELAIHCLDEPDEYAVLCNDIHAKILVLRYFTEGDYVKATGNYGFSRLRRTRGPMMFFESPLP